MTVLICGGTGTLGKEVLPILLKNPQIDRIRILSRGEHTQMAMAESLGNFGRVVDFFIGDVRDRERVVHASKNCSHVFHFAAMKSVDKAEYDPWEAVQTNIIGTKNVIEACLKNEVERAIFTSTDKAVSPLNIYGASKLVAEKLFIQANIGKHRTLFGVCRYGNVFGSQGSVLTKWARILEGSHLLPITHKDMTRFFISPKDAAEFVVSSAYDMNGGETFIPKMKSTSMIELAIAFMEHHGKKFHDAEWIGLRPGEKMHEVLVSDEEISLTTDDGDRFIRWPQANLFPMMKTGEPIKKGFTSQNAERFTKDELMELFKCQQD